MEKADHTHRKALRAHRRTVSSNLEELCVKLDPRDTQPKEHKPHLLGDDKISSKTWGTEEEHEVVRLLRASTDMINEKRVIVDNIEVHELNKSASDSYCLTYKEDQPNCK